MDSKISVIIPAYNEEEYLGRCLKSLKNQTETGFELIVVDNNSTDSTPAVARGFADRVLLCRKQGISSARNFGARHATGSILCFIDADSRVSRNWVKRVSRVFADNPRLHAISGLNLFEAENPLKFVWYNLYNLVVFTVLFIGNHFGVYFVAGNNMAITKELFLRVGGFPEFVGEDVRLSQQLRRYRLTVRFEPGMVILYSVRRFEKKGFFETLWLWFESTIKPIPESSYTECYSPPSQFPNE